MLTASSIGLAQTLHRTPASPFGFMRSSTCGEQTFAPPFPRASILVISFTALTIDYVNRYANLSPSRCDAFGAVGVWLRVLNGAFMVAARGSRPGYQGQPFSGGELGSGGRGGFISLRPSALVS